MPPQLAAAGWLRAACVVAALSIYTQAPVEAREVTPIEQPQPSVASAQPTTELAPPPQDSPRHLLPLPAEEDWSFLADPKLATDPFDGVKYIPIGTQAPDSAYVSLGGEIRYYYESLNNEGLGQIPGVSGYVEQRYLFHADLHPDAYFRIFINLQSESLGGRPGGPRPTVDKDTFDLLEGFAEYHSRAVDSTLRAPDFAVRVGRQQLDFGAGILVSAREGPYGDGPNVLQAFDGVRAIRRDGPWRLDVFAARPVQDNVGALDDGPAAGLGLWGAYLTRGGATGVPVPGVDVYYFGTTRPNAAFWGSGFDENHVPLVLTATEHRQTVGIRAYKSGVPTDYDVEAVGQFGTFGSRRIAAWSISADVGHTVVKWPWSPRFGLRAALNSGGSDGTTLRTHYAPYPRGVYFGALSAIGPENADGVELAIGLHPTSTLTVATSLFLFWRQNANDGVYALPGYPLLPALNAARSVGYQPAIDLNWQSNPHLSFNVAYEFFKLGSFLAQFPSARAVHYVGAWTNFRF